MRLVETIPLPNDLVAEVWDQSRPIAADTTKVELFVRVKVGVHQSYFTDPEHFELVKKILGHEIIYETKIERTFVRNRDKNTVFQELLDTFKRNSLPYLSKPQFPRNFVLSKYDDIEKNRYKYQSSYEETQS